MREDSQKSEKKSLKGKLSSSVPPTARSIPTGASRYWTFEENQQYVQFLRDHKKSFQNEKTRRSVRIFLEMSMEISSKTTQQCRTHHQKMILKYGNIDGIVKLLLSQIKEKSQMKPENEIILKRTASYEILNYSKNLFKIRLLDDKLSQW